MSKDFNPDDVTTLPAPAQTVILECIAEAWRNTEQDDATTEADVAADIAQRLHMIYRVTAARDDYDRPDGEKE